MDSFLTAPSHSLNQYWLLCQLDPTNLIFVNFSQILKRLIQQNVFQKTSANIGHYAQASMYHGNITKLTILFWCTILMHFCQLSQAAVHEYIPYSTHSVWDSHMTNCLISIQMWLKFANALELMQSCTKPSIFAPGYIPYIDPHVQGLYSLRGKTS